MAGLCLSVGLVVSGFSASPALSADGPGGAPIDQAIGQTVARPIDASSSLLAVQDAPNQPLILDDGVYLYGQVPEPDQIGVAYMVFEVLANHVVGAFYMPHSSFDCFQGEFRGNQLALQITDSYEQETYPYAIALNPGGAIADANGSVPPVELSGFNPLETVTDNDMRILNVCKADQQLEI